MDLMQRLQRDRVPSLTRHSRNADGKISKFSLVLANFPFSDDYWWLRPEQQTDDSKKKDKLKKEVFTEDGYKDPFGRFGRGSAFKAPPAGYGDYAFILHILASLKENDRAGIVCPQGVPLPGGNFDPDHYRRIHHHLFQDVYSWAGEYRTVRTSKGGNPFCYPEHLSTQMDSLFRSTNFGVRFRGLNPQAFTENLAAFLAELNAIHPFREGNGRAQLALQVPCRTLEPRPN
jgi:hypothetical protein